MYIKYKGPKLIGPFFILFMLFRSLNHFRTLELTNFTNKLLKSVLNSSTLLALDDFAISTCLGR